MALITGTNLPDMLLGTVANDSIQGLLADDIVYGFDGNDLLQGGDGDDTLHGGSGNDTLDAGAGEDFFYGGSGIDTVSYLTAAAGLVLDMADASQSTGDARGDVFSSIERVELSNFADTFRGIALAETVLAGGGQDTLFGFGGNDSLSGSADNDRLIGGAGADLLDGGAGSDVASYEDAAAAVTLNLTSGVFTGDAAGDSLVSIERLVLTSQGDAVTLAGAIRHVDAGAGRDTVVGTAQGDTILGGSGRDALTGEGGNDLIVAGTPLILLPGQDSDSLFGGAGNDTLQGGAGDAFLSGGAGNDRLLGEGGNDTLTGGGGTDVLNGGAGFDEVIYTTVVGLDMSNSSLSTGDALNEQLISIEAVLFLGTGGVNTYIGSAAAMSVTLGSGVTATAIAGTGRELFTGMASVDYSRMTQGVELTSTAFLQIVGDLGAEGDVLTDIDTFFLTSLDDEMFVSGDHLVNLIVEARAGNDRVLISDLGLQINLEMGSGDDTVSGFASDVLLTMGNGRDVVNIQPGQASNVEASVSGGLGDDDLTVAGYLATTVDGEAGNDEISASAAPIGDFNGAFTVTGGLGDDTISGTAFVGLFSGGDGADAMTISARNPSAGFLTIDGGVGADVIEVSMDGTAVPNAGTLIIGGEGDDAITGSTWFANYEGGAGNDTIGFTSLAVAVQVSPGSVVDGGGGNDSLTAMNANETAGLLTMTGGIGNDTMTGTSHLGDYSGGDGDDTLEITGLSAAAGVVTVDGGEGADDITFTSPNPVFSSVALTGGAGDDTINGSSFGGSYSGGDGDDTLTITCLAVASGGFSVNGGAGNDVITMTRDTPFSVLGTRQISVTGGAGDDDITGFVSSSISTERFVFNAGWGDDTLDNFDVGLDKLDFSGITGLDDVSDLTITGDGTQTVVSFGADSVVLSGVGVGVFDTGDLIFS